MAMEENNKLTRQSRELSRTEASSLTLQERVLLLEMDLTATNAKVVLEPHLSSEFLRVLSSFPAEAIQAAFRGWRDVSPFFPSISDIRQLASHWVRRQAEIRADQEQAQRRREMEEARERGELVDFADIKKEL